MHGRLTPSDESLIRVLLDRQVMEDRLSTARSVLWLVDNTTKGSSFGDRLVLRGVVSHGDDRVVLLRNGGITATRKLLS